MSLCYTFPMVGYGASPFRRLFWSKACFLTVPFVSLILWYLRLLARLQYIRKLLCFTPVLEYNITDSRDSVFTAQSQIRRIFCIGPFKVARDLTKRQRLASLGKE